MDCVQSTCAELNSQGHLSGRRVDTCGQNRDCAHTHITSSSSSLFRERKHSYPPYDGLDQDNNSPLSAGRKLKHSPRRLPCVCFVWHHLSRVETTFTTAGKNYIHGRDKGAHPQEKQNAKPCSIAKVRQNCRTNT